jgi:hypothetical protein
MHHLNYNSVETDAWFIQLPSDWVEKKTTLGAEKLYFESPDEAKGLYISTIRVGPDDHRSPMEHLKVVKGILEKSLNDMAGYKWVRIQDKAYADLETGELLLDNYDRENQYRIVTRVVVNLPYLSTVSVHDYLCDDLDASNELLLPILNSFLLR